MLIVPNFILEKAVRELGYSLESPQNALVCLLAWEDRRFTTA
jgi:hypothetical protein